MPLGVPSGTSSLQETRRYSRMILVSHLSAEDPLTVTSFFSVFHSSSVGAGVRPAASVPGGSTSPATAVGVALTCAFAGVAGAADGAVVLPASSPALLPQPHTRTLLARISPAAIARRMLAPSRAPSGGAPRC